MRNSAPQLNCEGRSAISSLDMKMHRAENCKNSDRESSANRH